MKIQLNTYNVFTKITDTVAASTILLFVQSLSFEGFVVKIKFFQEGKKLVDRIILGRYWYLVLISSHPDYFWKIGNVYRPEALYIVVFNFIFSGRITGITC